MILCTIVLQVRTHANICVVICYYFITFLFVLYLIIKKIWPKNNEFLCQLLSPITGIYWVLRWQHKLALNQTSIEFFHATIYSIYFLFISFLFYFLIHFQTNQNHVRWATLLWLSDGKIYFPSNPILLIYPWQGLVLRVRYIYRIYDTVFCTYRGGRNNVRYGTVNTVMLKNCGINDEMAKNNMVNWQWQVIIY